MCEDCGFISMSMIFSREPSSVLGEILSSVGLTHAKFQHQPAVREETHLHLVNLLQQNQGDMFYEFLTLFAETQRNGNYSSPKHNSNYNNSNRHQEKGKRHIHPQWLTLRSPREQKPRILKTQTKRTSEQRTTTSLSVLHRHEGRRDTLGVYFMGEILYMPIKDGKRKR